MDKGPFSIYDFIGYALPGAFTISLIQLYNFDVIQEILDVIYKQSKGMTSIYIISFVIISYVLGQLINFLS